MYTIRLHLPWPKEQCPPLFRQTAGGGGIWGDYKFTINKGQEPCDFLVVFAGQEGLIDEPIKKQNTLFVAGEPPDLKKYPEAYLAQFGSVICSDQKVFHPRKQLYQQGYPWFCGLRFTESGQKIAAKSYDEFKRDTQITKTKLLSAVCSDKCSKPGHRKRFEFVTKLKHVFGNDLDLYGTGQNPIADKTDAIRPYKYHIAIENSSAPHYWTEKLSDCYLEEAYPFYAGCPNLENYFPRKAYTLINLDNIDQSVETIRKVIRENRYDESIDYIKESKRLVLDEYNLFNLISEHFARQAYPKNISSDRFKARPAKWFKKGPLYRIKFALANRS